MSLVRGDLRVGDGLDPSKQSGCLPHRGDQMCSYTGSYALALESIRESVQVFHSNSHVSAWRFVDWLISDHVESIAEVMWRKLPFLIYAPQSTIGIALLAKLLLLVWFSVNNQFIVADIEDKISSLRWKDWETRKTWRVRW